jgi:hypothetical protein
MDRNVKDVFMLALMEIVLLEKRVLYLAHLAWNLPVLLESKNSVSRKPSD